MSDTWITIILACVAAAPGLAALIMGRRKDRAEAETSYQALYEKSVARISQLEKRVSKLEKIVELLEEVLAGAHKLYHQVKAMGGMPVYQPPEYKSEEISGDA
jgi:uncharacterized coiled-coil protein SlyX